MEPNGSPGDQNAKQAKIGVNPTGGLRFRAFMEFPTTYGSLTIKGKKIITAKIQASADHTHSCSNTPMYLYRTNAIVASPDFTGVLRANWSSMSLSKYLDTKSFAANETSCGQGDFGMDFAHSNVLGDVQLAANSHWPSYTVGIAARDNSGNDSDESLQERWKRFHLTGFKFVVEFNSVPGTPTGLTSAGVACTSGPVLIGTLSPALKATLPDADGTQLLTGTFQWLEIPPGGYDDSTPRTTVNVPNVPAGGLAQTTLSGLTNGKSYAWRVRGKDPYNDQSPWSSYCEFTVDASVPAAPEVDSPDYPDDGLPHGGPGIAGDFTFDGDSTVVRYKWGWTFPPATVVTTTAGAPRTITATPPKFGNNIMFVIGENAVGNPSLTASHTFVVGAPADPVGRWRVEKWPGEAGQELADQAGTHPLTGNSGLTWVSGTRLVGSDSANFNGTGGRAVTSGPVLDTTASFGVSAWVRLTAKTSSRAVVSQEGTWTSGFVLLYDSLIDRWVFEMYLADSEGTPSAKRVPSTTSPPLNVWTYVAATYDAGTGQMYLYVDGVKVGPTAHTSTWNATGPLAVGRTRLDGVATHYWAGQIADLKVWDRALVDEDLLELTRPVQVGRWGFDGDCCGEALDLERWNRSLMLTPTGTEFAAGAGAIGDAVHFDGVAGAATTSGPVLRTDQSFTVTARVWLDLLPSGTTNYYILGQDSSQVSGFQLGTRSVSGQYYWGVNMWNTDSDTGGQVVAVDTTPLDVTNVGQWFHLVMVFNASTKQIRLYVDGHLVDTSPRTASWQATGGLSVGRAFKDGGPWSFWPGAADDVRVFAGAASDAQVTELFTGLWP